MASLYQKLKTKLYTWLTVEPPTTEMLPFDFGRLRYEVRPGDVLLIEGRSRISRVIRSITQSPWTHAALYIGRPSDFEDEKIRDVLLQHTEGKENVRLIIEDILDKGTIIEHLSAYRHHHIRICRPIGIAPADIHLVINYALKNVGQPYNVRQLVDLGRFLLPWSILPRRWGSSLFRTSTGALDSGVCSSLLAEAFSSVQFPILPFVKSDAETGVEVFQRNPYLFTPKDFDFSPYFNIIKYPIFNPEEPLPYYRRLPWTKSGFLHQDNGILSLPKKKKVKKEKDVPPKEEP
ncbi:MAG TPA: YiiX/YebB-like N1pC/P60 family cysteine hydrolase [Gammaproteobacteria bacterium]|jgi:hypothetical protein|nr:YiiX/YebB-like N1pC/P60 family cysteine hydrolase [Gammaproteobacteria bacterium]